MSEVFAAIDMHTRLCEFLRKRSTDFIYERNTIAHSNMLYRIAAEKGVNLSHTVASVTDAITDGFSDESRNDIVSQIGKEFIDFIRTDEGKLEQFNECISIMNEERSNVEQAETIFVSEQIMEEVHEAVETLPDNVLLPQDLFVSNGLLIFEKPLEYSLIVQNELCREVWNIHSLQFNPSKHEHGIEIRMYGNWVKTISLNDDASISYNATTKSFAFENVEDEEAYAKEFFGVRSGDLSELLARRATNTMSLVDITFYQFNSSAPLIDSLGKLKQFLIALFRMTHSYIDVEKHRPPRHFTKRAKRAKRLVPEEFYLTVLTLRHKFYHGDGTQKHSSPKYAYRVRGHWKKAFLPSKKLPVGTPEAYRYVYISDYIKGKDKQLVESTRVIRIAN